MLSRTPTSFVRMRYRLALSDGVVGIVAPALGILLRDPGYFNNPDGASLGLYSAVAGFVTLFSIVYFRISSIVPRFVSRVDVANIVKASAFASLATAGIVFGLTRLESIPRSMPALHFFVLITLWIGTRYLIAEFDKVTGRSGETQDPGARFNLIIVGANKLAVLYMGMLDCMPRRSARILALLDDAPHMRGRTLHGHLVAGNLAAAEKIVIEYASHGVFVNEILVTTIDPAERLDVEDRLGPLCEARGIRLEYIGDKLDLEHATPEPGFVAGDPVQVDTTSNRSLYLGFRRFVEIGIAVFTFVFLAPVIALIWLLVLLDVGFPAVFWQERVGRGGKSIFIHKFRTLRGPVAKDGSLLNDAARLSPIGRFLRATRLDELPQIFDVLRGDMSLIGPRPLLPIDLPRDSAIRQRVAPGISGWAQVHGGKHLNAEEKNALDEWYVCNASFRVDIHILALTLVMPFKGDLRNEKEVLRSLRLQRWRMASAQGDAASVRHAHKTGLSEGQKSQHELEDFTI